MNSQHLDLCVRCSGIGSDTIHCVMPDGIIPFQENILLQFAQRRERNGLDEFVVMPNHIHGIIVINRSDCTLVAEALHATPVPRCDASELANNNMSIISPKSGSLSVVVRSYKSAVTKHAHKFDSNYAWQANFHENIICTAGQLKRIRKYVSDNPKQWKGNEKIIPYNNAIH